MGNAETIALEREAAIRALGELFSNPKLRAHVYRRYILGRRASGELVFEREPFDFYVEQAIAKAFGRRRPRRRMIRIPFFTGKAMSRAQSGGRK